MDITFNSKRHLMPIVALLAMLTAEAADVHRELVTPMSEKQWLLFGHGVQDSSINAGIGEVVIDVNWQQAAWGVGGLIAFDQPIDGRRVTSLVVEVMTLNGMPTRVVAGVATADDAHMIFPHDRGYEVTSRMQTLTFPFADFVRDKPEVTSRDFAVSDWQKVQQVKLLFLKPESDSAGDDRIFIRNPILVMTEDAVPRKVAGSAVKTQVALPKKPTQPAIAKPTTPKIHAAPLTAAPVVAQPTKRNAPSTTYLAADGWVPAEGSNTADMATTSQPASSTKNTTSATTSFASTARDEPYSDPYEEQRAPQSPTPTVDWNEWPLITDAYLDGEIGDIRSALVDRGITFEGDYTFDLSKELAGGVRTHTADRSLLNLKLTLDLAELLGWDNGTVFVNYQILDGENGNQDTGDVQVYSNIDNPKEYSQLSELWLERYERDGTVRIRVGKMDANSDFAYVDNGMEFINSSMGNSPTIVGMPTYPDPATAVNVFLYPNDRHYIGVGIYDGATQEGLRTGSRGPRTFTGDPADLFYIGETGMTWNGADYDLPGRLALGIWHHDGTFARFGSGRESGTTGFYTVLEQTLWRLDDERALDGFLQYGYADENVSAVNHHLGAGVVMAAPFSARPDDTAGLGVSWVEFSDATGAGFGAPDETAIEVFYKVQLRSRIALKPDYHYIVNPGGSGALDDASVFTLRVEVNF